MRRRGCELASSDSSRRAKVGCGRTLPRRGSLQRSGESGLRSARLTAAARGRSRFPCIQAKRVQQRHWNNPAGADNLDPATRRQRSDGVEFV